MAEAVVTETTAEAPDPDSEQGCKTRVKNCLLSVWNRVWDSLPRKILFYVVLPLGLYVFDVITDLILAVQYYNSGDSTWFGLTLGFVLVPSIFINILSFLMSWDGDFEFDSMCLLFVIQLGVFPAYLSILYPLVRGEDVEEHINSNLPLMHLLEAMLESVPQLCLQLYILLLTGEQVSALKVITMVASLLAAVKAVVTFCYYNFINEAHRTCSCGFVTRLILLTVWKVVELSVRVLAIGLFASAFKPWIALPIGVQWLVMTATDICIDEKTSARLGVVLASLVMAVDTFSMIFSTDRKRSFWVNTVLTLLGNITMVTVWYTLKVGQDWYDVPALVGVIVGSVVSAGLGFIEMVFDGKIRLPFPCCCEKSPDEQDSPALDPATSTELNAV
ncbi:XK-related protein 6-like [Branchiostoma floridae x Branchiostoma belcheri]